MPVKAIAAQAPRSLGRAAGHRQWPPPGWWRERRCRRPHIAAGPAPGRQRAWIPTRFAGLCSGASGTQAAISASTSGVIRQVAVSAAPPCTTRCAAAVTVWGECPAAPALQTDRQRRAMIRRGAGGFDPVEPPPCRAADLGHRPGAAPRRPVHQRQLHRRRPGVDHQHAMPPPQNRFQQPQHRQPRQQQDGKTAKSCGSVQEMPPAQPVPQHRDRQGQPAPPRSVSLTPARAPDERRGIDIQQREIGDQRGAEHGRRHRLRGKERRHRQPAHPRRVGQARDHARADMRRAPRLRPAAATRPAMPRT